jgi:cytochrome c oxidase subunit III
MSAVASARRETSRTGVAIFLLTDAITFGALFAAYAVFRAKSPSWPHGAALYSLPLAALLTALLLGSAVVLRAAVRSSGAKAGRLLVLTAACGALFLAGQATEYAHLAKKGFAPAAGIVPAVFYVLTGLHGLHVLAGVLLLAVAARLTARGGRPGLLDGATFYWLFVDAVWVFLLVFVYVF